MSSVESSARGLVRSCWRREFGVRGRGDVRLLGVVVAGDERKRGMEKGDGAAAFCLRLKDNLRSRLSNGTR